MVQMVNASFEPEITMAFGARQMELLRTLHRRSCQFGLLVSVTVVAAMMTVGPWFLSHWSGGRVPPSRGLLDDPAAGGGLLLAVVDEFDGADGDQPAPAVGGLLPRRGRR